MESLSVNKYYVHRDQEMDERIYNINYPDRLFVVLLLSIVVVGMFLMYLWHKRQKCELFVDSAVSCNDIMISAYSSPTPADGSTLARGPTPADGPSRLAGGPSTLAGGPTEVPESAFIRFHNDSRDQMTMDKKMKWNPQLSTVAHKRNKQLCGEDNVGSIDKIYPANVSRKNEDPLKAMDEWFNECRNFKVQCGNKDGDCYERIINMQPNIVGNFLNIANENNDIYGCDTKTCSNKVDSYTTCVYNNSAGNNSGTKVTPRSINKALGSLTSDN